MNNRPSTTTFLPCDHEIITMTNTFERKSMKIKDALFLSFEIFDWILDTLLLSCPDIYRLLNLYDVYNNYEYIKFVQLNEKNI